MAYSIVWNVDADGDWNTAADWSTGVLPGASDDVRIHTADFHTITYSSGTSSINSLNVGNDAFTMTGGSLSIAAVSNFANALTVGGATLSLNSRTTVYGLFTDLDGSTIEGTGRLILTGGSAFAGTNHDNMLMTGGGTTLLQGASSLGSGLAGANTLNLDGGRTLENQGTLTITNGTIDLGNNPFATSIGGGTLKNDSGATIIFAGNYYNSVGGTNGITAFNNAGSIQITGEIKDQTRTTIDAHFTNTGTVDVIQGELIFGGGGSSAVSGISIDSGATLVFGGNSTFTLTGGGSLGSSGSTVEMTGASVNIVSSMNFGGDLYMQSLNPLTVTGNVSVAGQFHSLDSDVAGTGTLTLSGGSIFIGPAFMEGSGTTILQGTSTVPGTGTIYADDGRLIENQGTLYCSGTIDLGYGDFVDPTVTSGSMQNDAGGTIIFNGGNGQIFDVRGPTTLTNAGTLENINNANSLIGEAFVNTGAVSVTSGELTFIGGGSSKVNGFAISSGATIGFYVDPHVTSGVFTFNGGGTLGSAGSTVDIHGASVSTTASTNFGGALTMENTAHLSLAGNTTIDGSFYGQLSLISNPGTLTLAGGSLLNAAMEMTGSGKTILQGTTTGSGELYADGGQIIENQGTFTVGDVRLGDSVFDPATGGGTLKNDSGATIIFPSGSFVATYRGTVSFINAGLMDSTGSGTSHIYVPFINTGTVDVQSGELDVSAAMTGNGTVEVDSGATFVLDASATGTTNTVNISSGTGIADLTGGTANDHFSFAGNFSAADAADGGGGYDNLILNGDYSAGLTFGATTLVNVEALTLGAGHSDNLTTNDANVAAGQTLTVNGSALGASDNLTFNGSAESDGQFIFLAGAGNDTLTGGSGHDVFYMQNHFTSADRIDGGGGADGLTLNGDYSTGVTLSATTLINVETIWVTAGHNYNLTTNDANVAAGQTLTVNGSGLGAGDNLTFNGSAETDGRFFIIGGAGNDTLTDGAGRDTISAGNGNNSITGGMGADYLTGGTGADIFVYNAVAESTGVVHDTIVGFDFLADHFDLPGTVNAIDTAVTGGSLSSANFNASLASAIGTAQLGAHDAVLFTPNAGDFSGHEFLIVDANGVAGYQAGADYVFDITGAAHLGSLSPADFI